LFLAGVIIPYWQFVPWVVAHGLNVRLMFQELFSNRIGAFFGADVLLSPLVVITLAGFERQRLGAKRWLAILALASCGVRNPRIWADASGCATLVM
jgi:hypothetical protein